MNSKVSLSEFKSSLNLVKTYIENSSTKCVTRIEYRTFHEGMCEADLFILPKNEVKDEFEAFVTLCTYQLHFYEEWVLADTAAKYGDSILNNWMLPEVERYAYASLSSDDVHNEVDSIIRSILDLLNDSALIEERSKDPSRWGVFKNDERVPSETVLSDFGIDGIVSGIGFNLEWNSVDIMYFTDKDYVFFSWGTGA